MTVIPLGRTLPCASSYLPAGSAGHTSTPAYLVLLQVEIARFTQTELARLCCSDPHLAVDGGYPLPCPVESGLSSTKKNFAATVWRASAVMVSRGCGVTWGIGLMLRSYGVNTRPSPSIPLSHKGRGKFKPLSPCGRGGSLRNHSNSITPQLAALRMRPLRKYCTLS